jgi:hypothetical protein
MRITGIFKMAIRLRMVRTGVVSRRILAGEIRAITEAKSAVAAVKSIDAKIKRHSETKAVFFPALDREALWP